MRVQLKDWSRRKARAYLLPVNELDSTGTKESAARFFAGPELFRQWLEAHHNSATELWVGFYRKVTGRPSITWPQSVDEALCFGWIDGIRKSIDNESYKIRFTPRKRNSTWSAVNIGRVNVLQRERRMHRSGLAAFEKRTEKNSAIYSFENRKSAKLGDAAKREFRRDATAWKFFQAQPPGYRRLAAWWVISAKRPETREKRLQNLIRQSRAKRRVY
jgi:uncharacterized protein YdeI (YjbR/CyaY-like superfamily)